MTAPRELPSVDRLAAHPALAQWRGTAAATQAVRAVIDGERALRLHGETGHADDDALAAAAAQWLRARLEPGPLRVINATGIVVHTNLGRAPLSAAARDAVQGVTAGYSALELDLQPARAAHATTTCDRCWPRCAAPRTRWSPATTPRRCCWR